MCFWGDVVLFLVCAVAGAPWPPCVFFPPVFGIITVRHHLAEGGAVGFLGHVVIISSPESRFMCLPEGVWSGQVGPSCCHGFEAPGLGEGLNMLHDAPDIMARAFFCAPCRYDTASLGMCILSVESCVRVLRSSKAGKNPCPDESTDL